MTEIIEINAYNFGNAVRCVPDKDGNYKGWTYCDNGDANTKENYQKRICPRCNLHPTENGQDPCISNLIDVEFACCGHGLNLNYIGSKQAYIKFSNGETIRFSSTDELLDFVKAKKLRSDV